MLCLALNGYCELAWRDPEGIYRLYLTQESSNLGGCRNLVFAWGRRFWTRLNFGTGTTLGNFQPVWRALQVQDVAQLSFYGQFIRFIKEMESSILRIFDIE